MKLKGIETLVWALIYSGLLIAALGLFLRASEPVAGVVLIVAGLVDAAAGIVLIWLRSRMTSDSKENDR